MQLASFLLTDIDIRYRNTYTPQQKFIWMNDEQNEIISMFKIEGGSVNFPLIKGVQFYPLPVEIQDIDKIKTATIQINDNDLPEFIDLPYRRNHDGVLSDMDYWYTIVADSIYINIPGGAVDDRQVYFYVDSAATPINGPDSPISIPSRYLEILKLGTLKRIASARKDVVMANNYDAERKEKIDDMAWTAMISEPTFSQPTSSLPRRGR